MKQLAAECCRSSHENDICAGFLVESDSSVVPRAGSGVVRIDPLRFLVRMSYMAIKPGLVSVLYPSMHSTVLLFIRPLFMYR